MDLELNNSLFIVTGGSSGLGKGVATTLLQEGAKLIIVARNRDKLLAFQKEYPKQIEILAGDKVTLNVLAPGFHETPAAERLFIKRSQVEQISVEEAKKQYEEEIMVGRMGNPDELGSLAAWLLSKRSGYITGQTISVDGGMIKGTMG